MFSASPALTRSRGRKALFDGDRLKDLIRFLEQPGATNAKAASFFGCSESTVEKALARARRMVVESAPRPDTTEGRATPDDQGDAQSLPRFTNSPTSRDAATTTLSPEKATTTHAT
jgi:hypothetical protein